MTAALGWTSSFAWWSLQQRSKKKLPSSNCQGAPCQIVKSFVYVTQTAHQSTTQICRAACNTGLSCRASVIIDCRATTSDDEFLAICLMHICSPLVSVCQLLVDRCREKRCLKVFEPLCMQVNPVNLFLLSFWYKASAGTGIATAIQTRIRSETLQRL